MEGGLQEVRQAGDVFRCPVCLVGWVHVPLMVRARGGVRYVRCDRCRALYRVQVAPATEGEPGPAD